MLATTIATDRAAVWLTATSCHGLLAARAAQPGVDGAARRQHPPVHSAPNEGAVPSLFIDGEWVAPASGATQDVINPSDATIVQQVDVADDAYVQRAIADARRAFEAGELPRSPVSYPVALLNRTADLLERDRDAIARAETLNTGKALRESCWDVDDVIKVFRYYAQLAADDHDRPVLTPGRTAVAKIVHEPIGVCALIG